MKIPSLVDDAAESEKVILGSFIIAPSLWQTINLSGAQFSVQNGRILSAMGAVFAQTGSLDAVLILDELRRRGELWEGAAFYISTLTDGLPRHVALQPHLQRISTCYKRRKLAQLCESTLTACYEASIDPSELLTHHLGQLSDLDLTDVSGDNLGLLRGCDITPEIVKWLIVPYLPHGQQSLLVGDPGSGKTFVAIAIAAGITVGRPPFSPACEPRNVLYLSNEDAPSILLTRFLAHGGDPARIFFESPERGISLKDHGAIEAAIKQHDAALVVIDTLTTHFGAGADFHKASEVASVLSPLSAMAARTGTTLLALMHLSKSAQSQSLYRVQGSVAFAGAARSILAIGTDPADASSHVLTHLKSNGGELGTSRRFAITDGAIRWGDTTTLRAADVLGQEQNAEDRSDLSAAVDFLREALRSNSRDAAEVQGEAKSMEIAKRTLARAKSQLGVISRKTTLRGGWIWSLPEECHEECQQECQTSPVTQTLASFGNVGILRHSKGLI